MKQEKEDLFQLIKALTPHEKRYFIQYAKRHKLHTQNDYLWLFLQLDQQSSPDWKTIQQMMDKDTFKSGLSKIKKRLYDQLLKSMRAYSEEHLAWTRIMALLSEAEYLRGKGLMYQFKKRLEMAKDLAIKYDHNLLLNQIMSKEWIVHYHQINDMPSEKLWQRQESLGKQYMLHLKRAHMMRKFNSLLENYAGNRSDQVKRELGLIKQTLSAIRSNETPITLYLDSLTVQFRYAFHVTCDIEQAAKLTDHTAHYLRERSYLMSEYPLEFCLNYSNVLMFYLVKEQFSSFLMSLEGFKKSPVPKGWEHRFQLVSHRFLLNYYLRINDLEQAKRVIHSIERFDSYRLSGLWKSFLEQTHLLKAFFFFRQKEYEAVIKEVEGIVQTVGVDFKIIGYFLLFLSHDKLKEPTIANSMYRRIKYHVHQKKYDLDLFTTLLKLAKCLSNNGNQLIFRRLMEQYNTEKHREMSHIFLFFDIQLLFQTGVNIKLHSYQRNNTTNNLLLKMTN